MTQIDMQGLDTHTLYLLGQGEHIVLLATTGVRVEVVAGRHGLFDAS